jgi:hypothetical protein
MKHAKIGGLPEGWCIVCSNRGERRNGSRCSCGAGKAKGPLVNGICLSCNHKAIECACKGETV